MAYRRKPKKSPARRRRADGTFAPSSRRSNPRRPAKRKRPSTRACSSRAWKLKMAPSRRAGSALRACRKNPSGRYTVKVTGRRAFHTNDRTEALWHAKRATNSDSRAVAVLYEDGAAVWSMRRGAITHHYR